MRRFITQLARFGLVGLVGLVIDVSVFNLLRATVLEPSVLHEGPFIAKIISTMLAIAANYVGNRYWTFGATRRSTVVREGLEFVAVSVGGMLIALACLWVSHYALGFTSVLADNISSNVVGLVLGTAFRFAFYRYWVFHPNRNRPLLPVDDPSNDETLSPVGAALAHASRIPATSTRTDSTQIVSGERVPLHTGARAIVTSEDFASDRASSITSDAGAAARSR